MTTGTFDFEGVPHDVTAIPQTDDIEARARVHFDEPLLDSRSLVRNGLRTDLHRVHFDDPVELVEIEELHEAQEEIIQLKKKIEELEAEQAHLTGYEPELGGDRKVKLNASI